MITDPKRVKLADKGHPDICNVFSYYKIFDAEKAKDAERWCKEAQVGCTECKKRLADIVVEYLRPHSEKRSEILKEESEIARILKDGAQKAGEIASHTMSEVFKAMGMK